MSTFDKLKRACEGGDYMSFEKLTVGEYKVQKFELIGTQYGQRIRVTCEDFFVYLPSRFSLRIGTQLQIDELNGKKYLMVYKGKDSNYNNRIMLDFEEIWTAEDNLQLRE